MAIALRLCSFCPRISKRKGRLVASTAWRIRLLTLGLFFRQLIVDPKERAVILRRRFAWFFRRRRRIPFDAIEAVAYGYADMNPAASWTWAHDSYDVFTVHLRLRGGKEAHLFHFVGDGTFQNDGPLPDWFYWEKFLTDLSGRQQRESRSFVELLSRMIGVPVDTLGR